MPIPTTPKPSEIDIISDQPVAVDFSESGKRQARVIGGHLWRIKVKYPAMTRAEFAPIFAFLNSLRSRLTSFTFIPANTAQPQGNITNNPNILIPASVGDSLIGCNGVLPVSTTALKAGDFVKFGNHSKVYMIRQDAPVDGTGLMIAYFDPPLIEDVPAGQTLFTSDVPFTVALEDDAQEWKTTRPNFSAFSFDAVEHL